MTRRLIASIAGCALLAIATSSTAATLVYEADMSGLNEVGPNVSPAIGFTRVTVDTATQLMDVHVTWQDLVGGLPAAAHIHCCAAPGTNVTVAVGFPAFPSTLSGTYDHQFDLTAIGIYNGMFLANFGGGTAAGAEAALLDGLAADGAYSNIHNASFPGGEIRGLLALAVPEPSSWALMIVGVGFAGAALRRRKGTFA